MWASTPIRFSKGGSSPTAEKVCNRYFLICEDLDMCCACAQHLHERGEPVEGIS